MSKVLRRGLVWAFGLSVLGVSLGADLVSGGFSSARADDASTCALDGVRIAMADAGSTTTVEISARLKSTVASASTCSVAWSRLSFAGVGTGGTPIVVLVDGFVDEVRTPPLLLADGFTGAAPRDVSVEVTAEGKVVALRLVVEGTDEGLHLEVPRGIFPRPTNGARVERRVKSARASTARFGVLGELGLEPKAVGPAGGMGPTGPFDQERIVVEHVPTGAPIVETVASSARVLDGFRQTLVQQALDLSPANDAGWDELARRSYAAAVHGDPVVASLGVSSLAWLASGLDLKVTRLAKAASAEAAMAPASVVDAIGDVDARLSKRYGAVGRLLPLGRPAMFRRLLNASPWVDAPRAKAAKDAVARLSTFTAVELAAYVTTSIIEDTAPIAPPDSGEPIPSWGEVTPTIVPSPSASPKSPSVVPGHPRRHRPRFSRRMLIALGIAAAASLLAALAYFRRATRKPTSERAY